MAREIAECMTEYVESEAAQTEKSKTAGQEGQEIGLRGEFNQATAKKPVAERRWGLTYRDTIRK